MKFARPVLTKRETLGLIRLCELALPALPDADDRRVATTAKRQLERALAALPTSWKERSRA